MNTSEILLLKNVKKVVGIFFLFLLAIPALIYAAPVSAGSGSTSTSLSIRVGGTVDYNITLPISFTTQYAFSVDEADFLYSTSSEIHVCPGATISISERVTNLEQGNPTECVFAHTGAQSLSSHTSAPTSSLTWSKSDETSWDNWLQNTFSRHLSDSSTSGYSMTFLKGSPPITGIHPDDSSTYRYCKVEYSQGNYEWIDVSINPLFYLRFSTAGSSKNVYEGDNPVSFTYTAPSSQGRGQLSSTVRIEKLAVVALATTSSGKRYSGKLLPYGNSQHSSSSTVFSYAVVREERQPAAEITRSDPTELSNFPVDVLLYVHNTGNTNLKVIDANASEGFSAELLDVGLEVAPQQEEGVRVRINRTGSGPGPVHVNLTLEPDPRTACDGTTELPDVIAGIDIPIAHPHLTVIIQGPDILRKEEGQPEDQPARGHYNVSIGVVPDPGVGAFNTTLKIRGRINGEEWKDITPSDLERVPITLNGSGNYKIPFTLTCPLDNLAIFNITAVADPEGAADPSPVENKTANKIVLCLAGALCSPNPPLLLIIPGFPAYSDIFCGFNLYTNQLLGCDENTAVKTDEDYYNLIQVANVQIGQHAFGYGGETAYLSVIPDYTELFDQIAEGNSTSYLLTVLADDQYRTIQYPSGYKNSIPIDYRCKVNVTVYNAPCTYYI